MLFGRVAVVTLTGADRPTASDEIVLEASNLLLQSGAKVCLVDVFNGACSALKSRCDALEKKYGANNVGYISCDIMNDTDALRRAFKKAFEHFGSLDIVINNFYVYDEENLEKLLKINLQSVISGTYNAMELMSPDKGAVIVNVSSMAGLTPFNTGPAYSAVKHGVVAFTRAMKTNVEEKGLRINCVCPGFVDAPESRSIYKTLPEPYKRIIIEYGLIKPKVVAKGIMDLITDTSRNGAILRANPWQGLMYQRYKEDMKSKL